MGVPYDERFCRPYGLEGLFHRPVYSLRGFQDPDSAFTGLARKITDKIDAETRLLAAIAYGEASTADLPSSTPKCRFRIFGEAVSM